MFHIRSGKSIKKKATLADTLSITPGKDRLMFVSAHDDDSPIGAGLIIAQAVKEGFDVDAVISTNGRMGYCTDDQRDKIIDIRAAETMKSYEVLGVDEKNVHWLGFDDGSMYSYIGRRKAGVDANAVKGYTGLENHLTEIIRRLKPTIIFTPSGSDLHPDHKVVYKELLISIFHASGDIWPELGEKVDLPEIYEYPTYVKLDDDPEIMFEADAELLKKKMECIKCYESQLQIDSLVKAIEKAGPVEFFRNLNFELYDPESYKKLFC